MKTNSPRFFSYIDKKRTQKGEVGSLHGKHLVKMKIMYAPHPPK